MVKYPYSRACMQCGLGRVEANQVVYKRLKQARHLAYLRETLDSSTPAAV